MSNLQIGLKSVNQYFSVNPEVVLFSEIKEGEKRPKLITNLFLLCDNLTENPKLHVYDGMP